MKFGSINPEDIPSTSAQPESKKPNPEETVHEVEPENPEKPPNPEKKPMIDEGETPEKQAVEVEEVVEEDSSDVNCTKKNPDPLYQVLKNMQDQQREQYAMLKSLSSENRELKLQLLELKMATPKVDQTQMKPDHFHPKTRLNSGQVHSRSRKRQEASKEFVIDFASSQEDYDYDDEEPHIDLEDDIMSSNSNDEEMEDAKSCSPPVMPPPRPKIPSIDSTIYCCNRRE